MSTTFKRLVTASNRGEILVPALDAFLHAPNFPAFSIKVAKPKPRPPDGWFHPSAHPLMQARQLYYYLTEPERLIPEPMDPVGVLAVTQGLFWHGFVETVFKKQGILTPDVPFQDDLTGARGTMDGVLASAKLAIPRDEGFEFKTLQGYAGTDRIPDGSPDDPKVLAWLKDRHLDYWAQVQEYMRLSGFMTVRMLFLSLSYPFPKREILVHRDDAFIYQVAEKYRQVRAAVATHIPPVECCNPGSKESKACPARAVCPVATMLG